MFGKRLLEKAKQHHHHPQTLSHGNLEPEDINFQNYIHYGIPSTASILAFDPIQKLLAIGTLDGRIKVVGGDGIEGLLISTNQLPFKHLEFLQNQGFLVSITNDNYIQVWNLETRVAASWLQWESNITAFSLLTGSSLIYIADDRGSLSVLKFDAEDGKLLQLPYHLSASSLDVAGSLSPGHSLIVGVLHQYCPSGNRILIAYQSGLLVLWDVSEAQALVIGGNNDLQLKEENADYNNQVTHEHIYDQYLAEKEISALCWASADGAILAVGYVDGDILFWNTSNAYSQKNQPSNSPARNVVRLQLSSAERRLPIVVLHWCPLKKSHGSSSGLLFIYGGDEIGSDERVTVLNLEWSSGAGALKCIGRADIALAGSFADMILTSAVATTGIHNNTDVFVLTNPGKLHLYDHASLYDLMSQQEGKAAISGIEYEEVIPTSDPIITVSKLIRIPIGEWSLKDLIETPPVTSPKPRNTKWPLTGGMPSELSTTKEHTIERLYITGYQDGSVRISDATWPILSFICHLQCKGVQVTDTGSAVSTLDLCVSTLSLAVGTDSGLVYVYNLKKSAEISSIHIITDSNKEVRPLPQESKNCRAVFSLRKTSVQVLQFANDGTKLAVGYQCGQVYVLDMISVSPLYRSDSSQGLISSVITMTWVSCSNINLRKTQKHKETGSPATPADESLFVFTKEAKVLIVEGGIKGLGLLPLKKKSSPIIMYVIEEKVSVSSKPPKHDSVEETVLDKAQVLDDKQDLTHSSEDLRSYILLCFEDSLRLYTTKSVVEGNGKTIHKMKLAQPCCWTSTFRKGESVSGLILLYKTGDIEIRSLPDLELVKETSLMSLLRWNYKANLDTSMSSDGGGQIALVNGGELAFISLASAEADSKILEYLPCLHDKVLAAAADAALNIPSIQKKKAAVSGIIEGIAKGLKAGKAARTGDSTLSPRSTLTYLEAIFSKAAFPDTSSTALINQEVLSSSPKKDLEEPELSIDDIDIDDPAPFASASAAASSHRVENNNYVKGSEKDKLFEGATDVSEPRIRTVDEIRAKYRKAQDASSVAGDARNKLLERQEKLERISRRTAELQSGAEDFASLANELVRTMESRKKWWHV